MGKEFLKRYVEHKAYQRDFKKFYFEESWNKAFQIMTEDEIEYIKELGNLKTIDSISEKTLKVRKAMEEGLLPGFSTTISEQEKAIMFNNALIKVVVPIALDKRRKNLDINLDVRDLISACYVKMPDWYNTWKIGRARDPKLTSANYNTYIIRCAHQVLNEEIERIRRSVDVPHTKVYVQTKILTFISDCLSEWGRVPSVQETASFLKCSEKTVNKLLLDISRFEKGEGTIPVSIIVDNVDDNELDRLDASQSSLQNDFVSQEVSDALEILDLLHKTVVLHYFGFLGEKITLEETAKKIYEAGLTKKLLTSERVRQLIAEALETLKMSRKLDDLRNEIHNFN